MIGYIIFKWDNSSEIIQQFREFNFQLDAIFLTNFGLVILLMGINYFIEIWKWNALMNQFTPISLLETFKGVMAGMALRFVTPNQSGDIAGRLLFTGKLNKIKSSILSINSYFAQLSITFIVGSFGFIYFLSTYDFHLYQLRYYFYAFAGLWAAILIFINFRFIHINQWILKRKLINKFITNDTIPMIIKPRMIWYQLSLSLLRYAAFSFQYVLFLWAFGIKISVLNALACISSIFLVQAILPGFLLIDLGIRGSAAMFFIGEFDPQEAGILLAAYSIWIINVVIPAIFGWMVIVKSIKEKNND